MTEFAPIFVGGTGRSGTTQLASIIGEHPQVWAYPWESRFLIDPGGLEDLVNTLTRSYTPLSGYDALLRFSSLLTSQSRAAKQFFGATRYPDWVEAFINDLTWYTYERGVPSSVPGGTEIEFHTRAVARYFRDRADLISLCRDKVQKLFSQAAADHGKSIWCEKTPFNIWSAGFLWELFPDARIVHIIRHPERVVISHLDQSWAPNDVKKICSRLEPLYQRFFDMRDDLDPARYIEVRIEDMAADWPRSRADLFNRLGLTDFETEMTLGARHTHMFRHLSDYEHQLVYDRLGFAFEALKYKPL